MRRKRCLFLSLFFEKILLKPSWDFSWINLKKKGGREWESLEAMRKHFHALLFSPSHTHTKSSFIPLERKEKLYSRTWTKWTSSPCSNRALGHQLSTASFCNFPTSLPYQSCFWLSLYGIVLPFSDQFVILKLFLVSQWQNIAIKSWPNRTLIWQAGQKLAKWCRKAFWSPRAHSLHGEEVHHIQALL